MQVSSCQGQNWEHLPVRVATNTHRHNSHTLLSEFYLPGKRPKRSESLPTCDRDTGSVLYTHWLHSQRHVAIIQQCLNQGLLRISTLVGIFPTLFHLRGRNNRYEPKRIKVMWVLVDYLKDKSPHVFTEYWTYFILSFKLLAQFICIYLTTNLFLKASFV